MDWRSVFWGKPLKIHFSHVPWVGAGANYLRLLNVYSGYKRIREV